MRRNVIAVIHLPPLPRSSARVEWSLEAVVERAVREARVLEELGYDAVIVENFGDKPYQKRVSDPLSLASFTVVAREVARAVSIPVGLSLLRNSGREAYAVAVATGARFIRVNALADVVFSDSGVLEPEAPRLRDLRVNYPGVEVYADVLVKHAASSRLALSLIEAGHAIIAKGSVEDYVKELILDHVERCGASALIVTGLRTGEAPPLELVAVIRKLSPTPVLVGSGVTAENVREYLRVSDGVIVGSYIRDGGRAGAMLDAERARRLLEEARAV
ncbi:MAG: BtpA/SgcQ family protein [Acidilobaceae archaeon]